MMNFFNVTSFLGDASLCLSHAIFYKKFIKILHILHNPCKRFQKLSILHGLEYIYMEKEILLFNIEICKFKI